MINVCTIYIYIITLILKAVCLQGMLKIFRKLQKILICDRSGQAKKNSRLQIYVVFELPVVSSGALLGLMCKPDNKQNAKMPGPVKTALKRPWGISGLCQYRGRSNQHFGVLVHFSHTTCSM